MSEYKVITISRQFGSGGHEIGEKLAARLGIPLYDNQLISMAADDLGYTKESVERADESSLDSFMAAYSVTPMSYTNFISTASYMPSLDVRVFRKQSEIIQSLAQKGPCVIVGRCATTSSGTKPISSMSLSARRKKTGSGALQSATD